MTDLDLIVNRIGIRVEKTRRFLSSGKGEFIMANGQVVIEVCYSSIWLKPLVLTSKLSSLTNMI